MDAEIYEAPAVEVLGSLESVHGSGGSTSDGCSSGHYESDDYE